MEVIPLESIMITIFAIIGMFTTFFVSFVILLSIIEAVAESIRFRKGIKKMHKKHSK